ncbi:MAG: segregation and condensation protein A [Thiolinea sp.]
MTEVQTELPIAIVRGEQVSVLPEDLYIPPDALEVILEAFEGPLDLLLYLIKRQNLDICDIPIAAITEQYMAYVELMKDFKLDLAAEYLVMAAMLAEIKSRMLLPRREETEEEDDPRAELIRRLQEYEQCKQAASELDALPRQERDVWTVHSATDFPEQAKPQPEVRLHDILLAFHDVLKRADMFSHHEIKREHLSIRERMTKVLAVLQEQQFVAFAQLFTPEEGRRGAVVSLMAILELLKAQLIDVVQSEDSYAPLYIRSAGT